jgi:hypothetical protein
MPVLLHFVQSAYSLWWRLLLELVLLHHMWAKNGRRMGMRRVLRLHTMWWRRLSVEVFVPIGVGDVILLRSCLRSREYRL